MSKGKHAGKQSEHVKDIIGTVIEYLTLNIRDPSILVFANSVDPDQTASEEAVWSGSTLFAMLFLIVKFNLVKYIFLGLISEMGGAKKNTQNAMG